MSFFEKEYSDNTPVIEIVDIYEFVSWIRNKSLTLARIQIGKNFFGDPKKYIERWEEPDEDDLSEEYVFDELVPFLHPDEKDRKKFYILALDAQKILGIIANKLLYTFLSQLVDEGVLEMCWNSKSNDFMWRVSLK